MKNYKDILSDTLSEIKEEELKSIPDENEINHEFSDKFNRKSKKLIKEQKKYESSSVTKTISKIAAVIIATIIAVTLISKADASPGKILDWIYYVYEKYIVVIYDQKTPYDSTEIISYTLNEIPEGFFLNKHRVTFQSARTIWLTENKENHISLDQYSKTGHRFSKSIITTGTTSEFTVNSIDVICVNDDSNSHYYWEEKGYKFELSYPVELGKDFAMNNIGKLVEMSPL